MVIKLLYNFFMMLGLLDFPYIPIHHAFTVVDGLQAFGDVLGAVLQV